MTTRRSSRAWVRRAGPGWAAAVLVSTTGCVGSIGDHEDAPLGAKPVPEHAPEGAPVSGLRRLTAYEYDATLQALLGDDASGAALNLPADAHTPFDNDADGQQVSGALIEGAELLAGDAAERLLADPARRDAIVGCVPVETHDAACFEKLVVELGRRALRRPLDQDEVAARMSLLDFADASGDFYVAVGLAIRSFLEDPAFLYRVEIGTPESPGVYRLDGWEVASRLSYLVWASTPDDHLLDLAESGELADSARVRTVAEEMLGDPRALVQIERFHAMWMGYEGLLAGPLAADMRAETAALFERVVGGGMPWAELFRSPETWVTPELAAHYGIAAPAGTEAGWMPYGESGRAGLLSQGSFLAIGGEGEVTNPTERGRLIRDLLLCQPLSPPNGKKPSFAASVGPTCKTKKYEAHLTGGCAGCHSLMDGIGFGLENYDTTGKYRLYEPDNPSSPTFDESQCPLAQGGELVLGGSEVAFSGPGELGLLLADSDELGACMVRQFYRFAMGRTALDDFDETFVAAVVSRLGQSFAFNDVVLEIVSNESFLRRMEKLEEE